MRDSIVQSIKGCFVCGSTGDLHIHHVFYGSANRTKSDEDGCWVYLCPAHHNMSSNGVHFNHKLDTYVKKYTQKMWMEHYTDSEDSEDEKIDKFIKRYGRNYIEDD